MEGGGEPATIVTHGHNTIQYTYHINYSPILYKAVLLFIFEYIFFTKTYVCNDDCNDEMFGTAVCFLLSSCLHCSFCIGLVELLESMFCTC